jgi:hypothetical protein
LLFQVKGDSDFANILEKEIKSTDSDPAYQEIINFILQVKYYQGSKRFPIVSVSTNTFCNSLRVGNGGGRRQMPYT